jgi:hypothetical protein
MSESTRSLDQGGTAYDAGSESDTESYKSTNGPPLGYAPRYDHTPPPPPPCHAADGVYGPEHHRPACAQCAFHLRTIDGLQRELRRCRAELTKLHYIVAPDAPPPLERADDRLRGHSSPVMMSRPCRKFRRLDAPVLSPIARVDENNGAIRRRWRRGGAADKSGPRRLRRRRGPRAGAPGLARGRGAGDAAAQARAAARAARAPAAPVRLDESVTPPSAHRARTSPRLPRQVRILPPY